MAKNRENKGIFDVSDLAENAQKNIAARNVPSPAGDQEPNEKKAPVSRRTIKRETKSKRINLLVRPSDYEALVVMAEDEEVSLNELINRFIQENIK